MTRTTALRFFLLLLPLVALAHLPAEDSSADKSLILALESGWNQAELHHDANAIAPILADTFISVDHHGKLFSKSNYLSDLKDLSYNPEEISNSDTSVYLYGDVAVITSAYRTKAPTAANPSPITDALLTPGSRRMENGNAWLTRRP